MRFGRFLRHVGLSMMLVVLFASLPSAQVASAARDYCLARDGVVQVQIGTAECHADETSSATAFGSNSFASATNNSSASAFGTNSTAEASNSSTATSRADFSTAVASNGSFALVSGSDSLATADNGGWAVVRGTGSEATADGCALDIVFEDGVTVSCP